MDTVIQYSNWLSSGSAASLLTYEFVLLTYYTEQLEQVPGNTAWQLYSLDVVIIIKYLRVMMGFHRNSNF